MNRIPYLHSVMREYRRYADLAMLKHKSPAIFQSFIARLEASHVIVCDEPFALYGGSGEIPNLPQVALPYNVTWIEGRLNGQAVGVLCYTEQAGEKVVVLLHPFLDTGRGGWEPSDGGALVLSRDRYLERTDSITTPVLRCTVFILGLLTCKNVIQHTHNTPRPLRKRLPPEAPATRYHTIEIRPFGRASTERARHGIRLNGTSLHACRGHFKTWTSEAPLFGKITGTFWCPQHIRGNPDYGVVTKSYEVVV